MKLTRKRIAYFEAIKNKIELQAGLIMDIATKYSIVKNYYSVIKVEILSKNSVDIVYDTVYDDTNSMEFLIDLFFMSEEELHTHFQNELKKIEEQKQQREYLIQQEKLKKQREAQDAFWDDIAKGKK